MQLPGPSTKRSREGARKSAGLLNGAAETLRIYGGDEQLAKQLDEAANELYELGREA